MSVPGPTPLTPQTVGLNPAPCSQEDEQAYFARNSQLPMILQNQITGPGGIKNIINLLNSLTSSQTTQLDTFSTNLFNTSNTDTLNTFATDLLTSITNKTIVTSTSVVAAFFLYLWSVSPRVLLAKWTGVTVWLPGTNSSNTVEVYGGVAPETDQLTTVTALNRFHTILPNDFIIIANNGTSWHVVGACTDVLLGQYRDSSLAKGSTGTIHIVDDTFTDFTGGLTITGVRALQKLVNGDYVQLFWERVTTGHAYEWYAVKLPSGVAQDIDFHLTADLAHGDATATVAVDAYRNGIQASGTTTVNNSMHWSLPSAGHGWATLISYDPATGNAVYEIRAVRMTEWAGYTAGNRQILTHDTSGNTEWLDTAAQTVVTDMQNDTTAHLLQKKTRALTVIATAAESALTTIVGGTEDSC